MEFVLLEQDIVKKFNIRIKYVLMECTVCSHSYGVVLDENQSLELRDLVCKDCAAREKLDALK